MPEALHLTRFLPQSAPVMLPVTKFGGQPVWMQTVDWPLSKDSGKPLRFIGQIDLTQTPLKLPEPLMAYLFLQPYDTELDTFFEDNWAVITQPRTGSAVTGPSGPTIDDTAWLVEGERRSEPSWIEGEAAMAEAWKLDDDYQRMIELDERWGGTKIGGTLAECEIGPENYSKYGLTGGEENWHLLLQLPEIDEEQQYDKLHPADDTPLPIQYGDGGTGYFFLSKDGREAQCCWFMN